MWIVQLALRRPYPFILAAVSVLIVPAGDPADAYRYFSEHQHPSRQRVWQ
jgi:hypothetical protein